MKFVRQFMIILAISFVGELLHALLPLPVPASIYGLVLMLIGLQTGILPLSAVNEAGGFLIEIMPMLFIPAGVGLMVSWGALNDAVLDFFVALNYLFCDFFICFYEFRHCMNLLFSIL